MEVSRDSAAPVPATRFHTGLDQYIYLPLFTFPPLTIKHTQTHTLIVTTVLCDAESAAIVLFLLLTHTHVCVSITSEDITEIMQTYPNHG